MKKKPQPPAAIDGTLAGGLQHKPARSIGSFYSFVCPSEREGCAKLATGARDQSGLACTGARGKGLLVLDGRRRAR
jgi:hypothetical protein